jgi:hypothetical protein
MPPKSSCFTSVASNGGLLNVLKNECGISQAFKPTDGSAALPVIWFVAIWDTGATNSCISQKVIDDCNLAPVGMAKVQGVHGSKDEEAFLVNIYLPNSVTFVGVRVTRAQLPGADILVGMDILNQGDFAVTNSGGLTKFSFRCPSEQHIDFVEQLKAHQQKRGSPKSQRKKRPKGPGGKHKRR